MALRTMNVEESDPRWAKMYEIEKTLMEEIFGDEILQIEHVGSTSVPFLAAKPIIDIAIIVKDINKIDQFNDLMKEHGYTAMGEYGMTGRRYFIKLKDDGVNRTHHVHIFGEDNPYTERMIIFRNYLRINPKARQKYENTKRELSKKFYHDSTSYTDGKSDCVNEIIQEAREYFAKE